MGDAGEGKREDEAQASPVKSGPKRKRRRKLDPFRERIGRWIAADSEISAGEIKRRLAPLTGELSERTVRSYVHDVRRDLGAEPPRPARPNARRKRDAAPPVALEAEGGAATTPADPVPVPSADASGFHDLSNPAYFLNRELTWLNFNYRVLHEAADPRTPLLERVKFLAIVSNNLDEFFMKRIGGLKQQVGAGLHEAALDGRTPLQQIEACARVVRDLEARKLAVLQQLSPSLAVHGIVLARWADVSPEDREWLREYYVENIFPLVTPQATDPAHPFPFISNGSLNLLVALRYPKNPKTSLARVKVPVGSGIPRFLRLRDTTTFVRMESVMRENLDLLFPGMVIDGCSFFRVTRNSNTEQAEEQADDLLALIETELRERKFAPIVRLQVASNMPPEQRGRLAAELGLDQEADVYEVDASRGMLGMRDLWELLRVEELQERLAPELYDPPHHPTDHPALVGDRNIFHVIRDADSILLHHPYQSFNASVERFLREASRDPKVRAIKMTLYRTSEASRAIDYLIDAATNGKQVAVVVELKARFDEAANIRWATRMEQVGIHVTYGVVGLKTHCKAILVIRHDHDGLRRYAHIGTGNYHAGTARLYSDTGLLTSDPDVGRDLTELFNYLTTGYKPKRAYGKILPAPKLAKSGLLNRIRREIASHSPDSPGHIQFKTNALEDADVTRALYRAAQAGVRVDLIVRDTCRLRPGIEGLSDNVRVISVVGRFLEHARIYYFRNGGDEEYYIGSADCMTRNLVSRVELLCPVEDRTLRLELRVFLDLQINDRRNAWEMRSDGSYVQLQPSSRREARGCQARMIDWAESRARKARRLRDRSPRGIGRRNR